MKEIVQHFSNKLDSQTAINCEAPVRKADNCIDCSEKSLYPDNGWLEYDCRNKNYLYISKMFPAIFEENMELLCQLDNTPLDCNQLRVMAIGQGPGAEIFALKHYLYHHLQIADAHINLLTMDKTPDWLCEYDLIIEGLDYDSNPFKTYISLPDYFDGHYQSWAHQDKFAVDPVTELNDNLHNMFPVMDYGFDLTFIGHFFSNLSLCDAEKFSLNIREFVRQRYVLLRGRNNQQFYNNLEVFLKIAGGRVIYHSDSADPLEHQFTPEEQQKFRPDQFKSSVRLLIICDQGT